MKHLRHWIFLIALLFQMQHSYGQTAFQCFNFEPSGGTPAGWTVPAPSGFNNGWLINNIYSGSTPTPDQFAPITNAPNSYYLHVNNGLLGDDNAVFLAGGGSTSATSSSINTTGKTGVFVEFWCLTEDSPTNIQYSINNGAFITATTVNNLSTWTKVTISAASVSNAFDNVANLRIRFKFNDGTTDPGFAVDEICFYEVVSSNSITTGTITGAPFCSGATFNVPFTSTGTFSAGNVYTVQLSDASGSFASPTNIGTLSSTANSGTISCTIPGATPTGSGYVVRVVSSNPAVNGSNSSAFTINSTVTPSVSISSSLGTSICTGQSVTFTATPTNGGTSPTYQWQVNGVNSGTGSTFTTSSLVNGDNIRVIMTSNAVCPSSPTATSNVITMTVSGTVTPTVTISANPGTSICAGTSITFTPTPTGGGGSPTYQWQVNGVNVATGATFTSSTLNNGDVVRVIMTSSSACASPTTATSAGSTITINASVTPSVSISTSSTTICSGASATFTATPTNGGTSPSFQWQINGSNAGTTNPITFASLNDGDVVTCIMTSNISCPTSANVTSNAVTMTVSPVNTVNITVAASSTNICVGQSATFTITSISLPSDLQWQVNGVDVVGQTGNSFTSNTFVNGDIITVVATPTGCGTPGTSSPFTVTVNPIPNTSVSISTTSPLTICAGTSVTFDANPTNPGVTPLYNWQVNGVDAGVQTQSFTTTSLANGDIVRVIMISSQTCATPDTSNTITFVVNTPPTASALVAATTPTTICAGETVSFSVTPTNGGTTPTYQWQINAVDVVGETGTTFTATGLQNNDVVRCIMTSDLSCVASNPATSNGILITVNAPSTPSVSINTTTVFPVCQGTSVTFDATPVNGGTNPTYQWQINGVDVSGANSANFTTNTLNDNDVVTVIMNSSATCVSPVQVTSNALTSDIDTPANVTISIEATDTTICAGTSITFTATANNVGSGTYQWFVNGTLVSSAGTTFTSGGLANGDVVTCTVNSSLTCVSGNPATSTGITMVVFSVPTLSCTIPANGLEGQTLTFSATPTGGQSPFTYTFDFGNGQTQTNTTGTVTYAYPIAGNYTVVVNMIDVNGCSATCNGSISITAIPYPVASFGSITGSFSGCVPFNFCASNNSLNAANYEWTFGDGSPTNNQAAPCHLYSTPGTYPIQLVVSNAFGSDTMRANIIVYPEPVANFFISAPTIKNGIDLQFQDASQGANSWNWNFGDPNSGTNNTSTIQTPTHNFANFGNYQITLVVTNAFGCTDTIQKTYTVLNAVGIDDELITDLQVYPNPFKDQIRLTGNVAERSEIYLSLTDMLGRTVTTSAVNQMNPGDFEMDWNIDSELTNGIYFLNLNINGKSQTVKLVHQN